MTIGVGAMSPGVAGLTAAPGTIAAAWALWAAVRLLCWQRGGAGGWSTARGAGPAPGTPTARLCEAYALSLEAVGASAIAHARGRLGALTNTDTHHAEGGCG